MSRLFITQRELNLFSDITKEHIHDVVGQKIYYYPISEEKTSVHPVYNEAIEKTFTNPISIDALVSSPKTETTIGVFGPDQKYSVEAFVQYRDLLDKNIELCLGDFFSYGEVMYEITELNPISVMYGHVEEKDGYKITGTKSRESLFKVAKMFGPTDRKFTDADAVQTSFYQQRGFSENKEGPTADRRELQENGTLDRPDHPVEVSTLGDSSGTGSSFYGDDGDTT